MITKSGFTLTKFVSNVRGVFSTLNRMEDPTNGNVKALAAEDEFSHVLGLENLKLVSAMIWNPGSVNDTCGTNIYVDRQHYRPSVAAECR